MSVNISAGRPLGERRADCIASDEQQLAVPALSCAGQPTIVSHRLFGHAWNSAARR
jgi:hypothetical protein